MAGREFLGKNVLKNSKIEPFRQGGLSAAKCSGQSLRRPRQLVHFPAPGGGTVEGSDGAQFQRRRDGLAD
jgi:hypothetical protein